MAVITYKCDTCSRETDKVRNPETLEVIGPCTITAGCHGRLYQKSLKLDHIRGKLPLDVSGLDNWEQRRVFYLHEQTFPATEWLVEHNLEVFPSVIVYIEDGNDYIEIQPLDIIPINLNTVKVIVPTRTKGIVHCIARATSKRPFLKKNIISETTKDIIQISTNGNISFATKDSTEYFEFAVYTSLNTNPFITFSDNSPSTNSTWVGMPTNRILVNNGIFYLRDFNTNAAFTDLKDAATLTFTIPILNVNFREPDPKEIYILLAKEPFTSNDKILDNVIELSSVNGKIFYDSGEWFAPTSAIINVYPHIISV